MEKGSFPFRYLGVPLSYKKLAIMRWKSLINKILDKIQGWAALLLSYAGRVQLINSVLFGIQVYWSQIFLIPKKIIQVIQAACRNFLWTGKARLSRKALVAWERVCLPKIAGGLNIVDLHVEYKAAVMKLFWNLAKRKMFCGLNGCILII